jgi:hypothetical protein
VGDVRVDSVSEVRCCVPQGFSYPNESARGSQKSPSKPMLSKMLRISAAAGRRDSASRRVPYQVTARCHS